MGRPEVLLKFARSFDGCFDDSSETRFVFSGPEDKLAVKQLRSEYQAIFVGAETIRKDNPSLLSNIAEKDPLKVTFTASTEINPQSRFFTEGKARKIVYTTFGQQEKMRELLQGKAEVFGLGETEVAPEDLLADLFQRGIQSLLIEGGPKTIAQFLERDLIDSFRIAISPKSILDNLAPRLLLTHATRFQFTSSEKIGELLVLSGKRQNSTSS